MPKIHDFAFNREKFRTPIRLTEIEVSVENKSICMARTITRTEAIVYVPIHFYANFYDTMVHESFWHRRHHTNILDDATEIMYPPAYGSKLWTKDNIYKTFVNDSRDFFFKKISGVYKPFFIKYIRKHLNYTEFPVLELHIEGKRNVGRMKRIFKHECPIRKKQLHMDRTRNMVQLWKERRAYHKKTRVILQPRPTPGGIRLGHSSNTFQTVVNTHFNYKPPKKKLIEFKTKNIDWDNLPTLKRKLQPIPVPTTGALKKMGRPSCRRLMISRNNRQYKNYM